MGPPREETRSAVSEALALLGKRRLVLVVHDASFPGQHGDDLGRGSPYSRGARALLTFARDLGFNAIQLGPQGRTSAYNPSPYDATLFSKSELSLSVSALTDGALHPPLLDEAEVAPNLRPGTPSARSDFSHALGASAALLQRAYKAFLAGRADRFAALDAALARFRGENSAWLLRDGLFEALAAANGTDDWRRWSPALDRRLFFPSPGEEAAASARLVELQRAYAGALERHAFGQLLLALQHGALRTWLSAAGMKLFGDLQVGISHADTWSLRGVFLPGYVMGAPSSRTNPDGQPWNYPVLDPRLYRQPDGREGPALQLMAARMDRLLGDFDGVRIDHPHGFVCPWVYRKDSLDPFRAVRSGARLFSSPDLPDHPELARLSLVRSEQLDPSLPRHADGWVRELTEAQVDRYATLMETVMERARHHGRHPEDILCEVLSTWPYPLRRVMERYGLGRFLVTQKADPDDPKDLYRSETARPQDWVMPGTHDTESVWSLAPRWEGTEAGRRRAAYLAERLEPNPDARPALTERLARDGKALAQALLAELFASPAGNVSLFFADLFGLTDRYNAPGTVSPSNWSLRVAADFEAQYRQRREQGAALDLPLALSQALHARGMGEHPLRARLEAAAH